VRRLGTPNWKDGVEGVDAEQVVGRSRGSERWLDERRRAEHGGTARRIDVRRSRRSNAASPYDGDADDDPDDDSIREDLIDRIGDKVSGPENRSIGCRDPMFAAYLDHLADDGERMDDVIADLADDLNTTVPERSRRKPT